MGRSKIIDRPITDIATPWEFYAGIRVETFIKDELKKKVGYVKMIGSYLYAFTDYDHYIRYINDRLANTPLFSVDMNYDSDVKVSLAIETSSLSEATDDNNVKLKYYFITTDTDSGDQLYVENRDCQLSITVSTDGSTFYEVYTSTVKSMSKDSSVYSNVVLPDFQYDDVTTYTYHVKLYYNNIESNMLTFVRHMNPNLLLKPTKESYTYTQTQSNYIISYNIGDCGDNLNRKLDLYFTDNRGIMVYKQYMLSRESYVTNPFSDYIQIDEIDSNCDDNIINVDAYLYNNGDIVRNISHSYHYGHRIKSCVQTYPVDKQIPYIINGQRTYLTDIVMYYYTHYDNDYINIDVFDDYSLTHKIYSDKIVNPVQNTWYQIYLNINTNMTERRKHIWIQFSLSGGHNSIPDYNEVADPLVLETYLVKPLTE